MTDHAISIGRFQLNVLTHRLDQDGQSIQLSPLASRALQELAVHGGAVVDRNTLIDRLWQGDYLVGDPALNRVISEIRRAVGDDPRNPALIQTVHRRGYRLVDSATPAEAAEVEKAAPTPRRPFPVKGVLWLTALVLVIAGAKVLMDTMIGVLWVANAGR